MHFATTALCCLPHFPGSRSHTTGIFNLLFQTKNLTYVDHPSTFKHNFWRLELTLHSRFAVMGTAPTQCISFYHYIHCSNTTIFPPSNFYFYLFTFSVFLSVHSIGFSEFSGAKAREPAQPGSSVLRSHGESRPANGVRIPLGDENKKPDHGGLHCWELTLLSLKLQGL